MFATHIPVAGTRWNAPLQLAQRSAPCDGHCAPDVGVPYEQMHCLVAHWRSEVLVGAILSYCAELHVAVAAQTRSDVAVGATVSYCPLPHGV